MKELRTGHISVQELCQWFGIGSSTFYRNKEYWLSELAIYCRFTYSSLKVGRINIQEIYENKYVPRKEKAWVLIDEGFENDWGYEGSNLDSCSDLARRILNRNPSLGYSLATLSLFTRKKREELYGRPGKTGGKLGCCRFIFCTRDDATGRLRFLTEKEQEIKKECLNKYYGDTQENVAIVTSLIQARQIKEEEAWDKFESLSDIPLKERYKYFLEELRGEGISLIRGTLISKGAFEYIDENGEKRVEEIDY